MAKKKGKGKDDELEKQFEEYWDNVKADLKKKERLELRIQYKREKFLKMKPPDKSRWMC